MGEARRRRQANFGAGPVPVEARMAITRYAPRFGKARLTFELGGFAEREAYDALCAIKRAFEQRRGFAERPDLMAAAARPFAPPSGEKAAAQQPDEGQRDAEEKPGDERLNHEIEGGFQ